jgi:hypothetical protein
MWKPFPITRDDRFDIALYAALHFCRQFGTGSLHLADKEPRMAALVIKGVV